MTTINHMFAECLANVPKEISDEVRLNFEISDRIHDILVRKNMSMHDLAKMLGKRESEIAKLLSGEHGFTIAAIAKISAALGEPIIQIYNTTED